MFSNQIVIDQKQENGLIESALSKSSFAGWQKPLCAWCLCEQGIALGNGSHGICARHADYMLQQYRARRTHCYMPVRKQGA